MKNATRFDEQPGIGFGAAKWIVALIVIFGGGWLGESAGDWSGSHLIAGIVGIAVGVAIKLVLDYGEEFTQDDATDRTKPLSLKLLEAAIIIGVIGFLVIRAVQRFGNDLTFRDSTSAGFVIGIIFAAAIAHWRKSKALKRQQSA